MATLTLKKKPVALPVEISQIPETDRKCIPLLIAADEFLLSGHVVMRLGQNRRRMHVTVVHLSLDLANAEAARLKSKHPESRFFVLQIVARS